MSYPPGFGRPVPPPGAFVLRRHPAQETAAWQELKRGGYALLGLTGVIAVVIFMIWNSEVPGLFHDRGFWFVFDCAECFVGLVTVACIPWGWRRLAKLRSVERALAGLELWIAPEGVTYLSAAGVFPAPWSAVRRMYVSNRMGIAQIPPALFVEVAGWGGPLAKLAKFGKPCKLRMPLPGLGADPATIARAVHEISSGRASVAAR